MKTGLSINETEEQIPQNQKLEDEEPLETDPDDPRNIYSKEEENPEDSK